MENLIIHYSIRITTMSPLMKTVVFILFCLAGVQSARILGVYPTPSLSHQVVFRALTLELVKRGHEVVVITTDPAYKNKESPKNLTEIDVSDSYKLMLSMLVDTNAFDMKRGVIIDSDLMTSSSKNMLQFAYHIFDFTEVNKLIENKNQKFDLVIIESLHQTPLIFGKIFDAPVILFSSLIGSAVNYETVGAVATHPVLYPHMFRDNFNGGIINKIKQLYSEYKFWLLDHTEKHDNEFLESRFGSHGTSVAELKKRVVLLLLNCHPIFDGNRPVSPGTVYLGATHLQPVKELPEDLKSYLDNSKRGVVYVSLGTNVRPSMMHKEFLDTFLDSFEKIPYDILWKFDGDSLDRLPSNVKIQKWFPQRDLLDHPNIKLFVMQGGLQSTDEAIDAEVPLIGIPMLGDQWYNTNKYVELGIGVVLDTFTMIADDLVKAVNTVANDPRYKENMKKLKSIMRDQPQTSLERAVWWTEHVLRHKNSRHLLGAAAQISWSDYLMLDVLIPLAIGFIILAAIVLAVVTYIIKQVFLIKSYVKVKKH